MSVMRPAAVVWRGEKVASVKAYTYQAMAETIRSFLLKPSVDGFLAMFGASYFGVVTAMPQTGIMMGAGLIGLIGVDALLGSVRAMQEQKFRSRALVLQTAYKVVQYLGFLSLAMLAGLYADTLEMTSHPVDIYLCKWPVTFLVSVLAGAAAIELSSVIYHMDAVTHGRFRSLVKPVEVVLRLLEQAHEKSPTPTQWQNIEEKRQAAQQRNGQLD